jgi:hypothetical protein
MPIILDKSLYLHRYRGIPGGEGVRGTHQVGAAPMGKIGFENLQLTSGLTSDIEHEPVIP